MQANGPGHSSHARKHGRAKPERVRMRRGRVWTGMRACAQAHRSQPAARIGWMRMRSDADGMQPRPDRGHGRNADAKGSDMSVSKQRWCRLAVACLVMAAIGFIYGWSVFSAPLSQEFGWEPTVLSFTFTVLMWAFCAGGIVGARLTARTSTRTTLLCAAAGIFVSFALSALFLQQDVPWLMYLAYGGIGGCSVGMAYTTTMGASVAWFPERTGLASGMLLLCYGASTLVLGSVATGLFALIGWRWAFVALAGAIGCVVAVAACVLRRPTGQEADALPRPADAVGSDAPNAPDAPDATDGRASSANGGGAGGHAASQGAKDGMRHDYDTRGMLSRPAFWSYAGWMFLVSCIGLGVIGSANQLALEAGADVAVAVGLVGLLSVCNGCGRLVGGVLFDLLGAGRAMAISAALHFLGCVLAAFALAGASTPLMAAAVLVGGIGIGGVSALGSGFVATAFGQKHYAENLSILNLVLIPAALVGPTVMSTSATFAGGYLAGTGTLAALGAGALGLAALTGVLLARMRRG